MRNFTVVANEIQNVIIFESDLSQDVISDYHVKIVDIIANHQIIMANEYIAPELEAESWNELARLLNDNFNPNNSEWEKKIHKIFNDYKGDAPF